MKQKTFRKYQNLINSKNKLIHSRFMIKDLSINKILTNSKTYNDFPKITKSGIIYSPELVNQEFRNVIEVGDSIRAKKGDPKDVLQKVLKLLTSINETKIPKNNMEFINTIKDIVKQMNWIKNKSENS